MSGNNSATVMQAVSSELEPPLAVHRYSLRSPQEKAPERLPSTSSVQEGQPQAMGNAIEGAGLVCVGAFVGVLVGAVVQDG